MIDPRYSAENISLTINTMTIWSGFKSWQDLPEKELCLQAIIVIVIVIYQKRNYVCKPFLLLLLLFIRKGIMFESHYCFAKDSHNNKFSFVTVNGIFAPIMRRLLVEKWKTLQITNAQTMFWNKLELCHFLTIFRSITTQESSSSQLR